MRGVIRRESVSGGQENVVDEGWSEGRGGVGASERVNCPEEHCEETLLRSAVAVLMLMVLMLRVRLGMRCSLSRSGQAAMKAA